MNEFFQRLKQRKLVQWAIAYIAKIDPVWDPIRNDPGFQQLLAGKEHVGP